MILSVGASMFPFILPSSLDPRASLMVWDSSSSHLTLFIMLVVTAVFIPIIVAYTTWVYRVLWGKVDEKAIAAGEGHEVDLVAEVGGELIPFEVKYRAQHTGARELKGLVELCQSKRIERGYVVTKSLDDFGPMPGLPGTAQVMRVPAPLLCYWMGATELPGS